MSIIPASRLTSADLARLGNNVLDNHLPCERRSVSGSGRSELLAVNRSLAIHQESVQRLFTPPTPASAPLRARLGC